MAEITLVTAFFDIGRAKWRGFERDSTQYLEYFRFWASIKNKLIVYTDQANAKLIMQIREEFGLAKRTQVIVLADIYLVEPDICNLIKQVLANKAAVKFRDRPENPEAHAYQYNYLTYLKPWFVSNAVSENMANGMVAWIDFGYNHGGEACVNAAEFDFSWQYNFSDKIHIFATEDIDDMPIFDIIRKMRVYISGGIIVAPAERWNKLFLLFREAMLHLTHCGFTDADQTLLVMAYREAPDLFEVHAIDDWFMVLKTFGGGHLTLKNLKPAYKKDKRAAKRYWRNNCYKEALKYYLKYLQGKRKRGEK